MSAWRLLFVGMLLAGCSGGSGGGGGSGSGTIDPAVSGLDARPANPTCVAPARSLAGQNFSLVDIFPGTTFARPVLALQAPGDSAHLYVLEQGGMIYRVNLSGAPVKAVFADLTGMVTPTGDEIGLLGLAFHPDYASNRQVFVTYTTDAGGSNLYLRLSRFLAVADGSTLDTGARRDLLELPKTSEIHNGGNIAFHPTEGYLYFGIGDGGDAGDPFNRAQDTTSLFGKMLRIDVNVTDNEWNAGTHYKIPASNPYAGGGGRAEIYALGLRNPWRWGIDRQTGELWAGDVGQRDWEEVNHITRGGNYGWRQREGAHCYNPSSGCQTTGMTDPVVEYTHDNGRCAVTGGHVYRGSAIPGLNGQYVYGDYCSGEIWSIPTGVANPVPQLLLDSSFMISSFGEGANGELYVVRYSFTDGHVYRLSATGGAPSGPSAPAQLSQTGCMNAGAPTVPVSGLIPYDINAPFWSDGMVKERYLSVPDGARIGRTGEGRFVFPAGSVVMKNFRQNGALIETRLLMRHPDGGWEGYSYEWNAGQTDATLVTSTTTKSVNGQSWTFFASNDCLRCHTDSAVFTLGTEVAQLNRDYTYAITGRTRNQIATLNAVGLFSTDLNTPPTSLPVLPSPPDGSRTLTERARSWLHANCSNCHRPGGGTPALIDLRYDTALSDTGLCAAPTQGDLGVAGANIVTPGNPATSVLYLRLSTRGANQMPPIGTALVDADGAALIASWIQSLSVCP